jgi:hypothetical protein
MRQLRIKVPSDTGDAIYHCMSKTAGGLWLFDDPAKEVFRRQMWEVAEFCGVDILTYNLLSNHFHILALVPKKTEIADAELLRRFKLRHPPSARRQSAHLKSIEAMLARNGSEAEAWRHRQLVLMGDISQFMKLLKQGFSIWYNRGHARFGTLWAERFKSELVEISRRSVATVAAYIDLNCVRAGLVGDPKDYRFGGYAEAVAGNLDAQRGVGSILGIAEWVDAQPAYRQLLFGTGASAREQSASITPHQLQEVVAAGGQLPLAVVLRCRIRYFTCGMVLGGRAFVQHHLAAQRLPVGRGGSVGPWLLPPVSDWGDLAIHHRLRGSAFG